MHQLVFRQPVLPLARLPGLHGGATFTGEMAKIRENGATSGAGVLATYAYDNLGRALQLTRGNGAVTDYGYDAVSRLQTLTQKPSSPTYDQTVTYAYNPASQIVTRTGSNDSYAWTGHDDENQHHVGHGAFSSWLDAERRRRAQPAERDRRQRHGL